MQADVLSSPEAAAQAAAGRFAEQARRAIRESGRFVASVSGGHTPWMMLQRLGDEDVPWDGVHVVQVDERIAPAGDPDRNLTHLRESLLVHTALPEGHLHPMPVEESDPEAAALRYAATLEALAGSPPHLDLVHLGLGPDGHTASLVPGDSVLEVRDAPVALTAGAYQGRRRMTLTLPVLDAARCILWLITGAEKRPMVERLLRADPAIPAGRVAQSRAFVVADRAAFAAQRPRRSAS